ncbi:Ankyrin repeat-containing protein [Nymphaea thermarum]|nr:Ankyrin repeat-containing protein [Nymphaea thermarum]
MASTTRQISFHERKNATELQTMRQLSFHERKTTRELPTTRQLSFHERRSTRELPAQRLPSFHEKKGKRELSMKRGDTPLHLACRAGDLLRVQEIIREAGKEGLKGLLSKENQSGEIPLYVAAENGHARVVAKLLKVYDVETASVKARNGYDSFHIAAKQGHAEVLKEILRLFPELAMTADLSNSTALHSAAYQGHIDVVDLLLETDASLAKIARSNGKTALHSASRMGHVPVVRALLTKDTSLCLRTDKKGQTALHMAVKGQVVEVVRDMLRFNPSVIGLEDGKGNTALHIATRKSRLPMVAALLDAEGLNINAVNKAGETALDISEKNSNSEIAAILRERGAETSKASSNPPTAARQLKQTVSDIKHEVHSQIQQTQQTRVSVQKITKRLKKMHIQGLNNAINSATVVAVLIATVAFAAIFTVPGQFADTTNPKEKITRGQAYVAGEAAFIVFLIFDSLALFISLAVVVAQTSIVVIEPKAKKRLMFVINKLMWIACLLISIAFISLTYVVVGHRSWWLAESVTAIGGSIMLVTIGSMTYCVVRNRMEESSLRNVRRGSDSRSHSWSKSALSDNELLNKEKRVYAL